MNFAVLIACPLLVLAQFIRGRSDGVLPFSFISSLFDSSRQRAGHGKSDEFWMPHPGDPSWRYIAGDLQTDGQTALGTGCSAGGCIEGTGSLVIGASPKTLLAFNV